MNRPLQFNYHLNYCCWSQIALKHNITRLCYGSIGISIVLNWYLSSYCTEYRHFLLLHIMILLKLRRFVLQCRRYLSLWRGVKHTFVVQVVNNTCTPDSKSLSLWGGFTSSCSSGLNNTCNPVVVQPLNYKCLWTVPHPPETDTVHQLFPECSKISMWSTGLPPINFKTETYTFIIIAVRFSIVSIGWMMMLLNGMHWTHSYFHNLEISMASLAPELWSLEAVWSKGVKAPEEICFTPNPTIHWIQLPKCFKLLFSSTATASRHPVSYSEQFTEQQAV